MTHRVQSALALVAALLAMAPRTAGAQALSAAPERRPPLAPGERLVDEVVAALELEGDPRPPVFVLASDVALTLRFELASRGAPSPLTTAVDVSVSQAILALALGERLLEREAARAGDEPPTADEIEEERNMLAARLAPIGGVAPLLRAVGATPADFEAFVRRRLVVSRFLQRHLARSIEPSEVELRAAYDEERVGAFRAEGVPFAVARPEIREALIRHGYPRAVRSYLRSVGSRARVRVWTGEGEGEP
jgi:hypothetical protein